MKILTLNIQTLLTAVIITGNIFSQWKIQNTPVDVGFLLSVDFIDDQIGIASGWNNFSNFSGRLIYTTDGGSEWDLAVIPDSARSLVKVQMFSGSDGYAFGAYNSSNSNVSKRSLKNDKTLDLIKRHKSIERDYKRLAASSTGDNYFGMFIATTDGGLTWENRGKLPPEVKFIVDASYTNSDVGYILADAANFGRSGILKTTNAGNSWDLQVRYDTTLYLRKIQFTCLNTGVAVGYKYESGQYFGVIYNTADGGTNWKISEFQDVGNFTDVYWISEETVFAVGNSGQNLGAVSGVIYRSDNRGEDWSKLDNSPEATFYDGIRFLLDSQVGILFGEELKIDSTGNPYTSPFVYRTNDRGETWIKQQLPVEMTPETFFFGGDMPEPDKYYLSGGDTQSGVILHTQNGGVTSVEGNPDSPSSFILYQNYPNPFNPSTSIEFFLSEKGGVNLSLFDIKGESAEILIDGIMAPGRHVYKYNAGNLSSGVYLLKMKVNGSVQIKKILLLK